MNKKRPVTIHICQCRTRQTHNLSPSTYDKRWHSLKNHLIITYVFSKAPSTKDIGLYPITSFIYYKEQDIYICPQGNAMHTNGTWHQHSDNRRSGKGAYRFQRYNTPACKTCQSRYLCTQSKTNGRYIDRSEYAEVIESNATRVKNNPDYYRKRQQITEHMFGTLKRQRGFTHTNVRGKDKVLGEVGLMFIGYNLTRCVSILGFEKLIKLLRECYLLIFESIKRFILSPFNEFEFSSLYIAVVKMQYFGRLKTQPNAFYG